MYGNEYNSMGSGTCLRVDTVPVLGQRERKIRSMARRACPPGLAGLVIIKYSEFITSKVEILGVKSLFHFCPSKKYGGREGGGTSPLARRTHFITSQEALEMGSSAQNNGSALSLEMRSQAFWRSTEWRGGCDDASFLK